MNEIGDSSARGVLSRATLQVAGGEESHAIGAAAGQGAGSSLY